MPQGKNLAAESVIAAESVSFRLCSGPSPLHFHGQMKRLFLLDGMALVYRAHFAFINNPIRNSKGVNTSALYGFTNTLLQLLEKEKPTHIGVSFDTSAPTPRHDLYPSYKAQRDAMPEELAAAIPEVKKLVTAFNIPLIIKDGYEADDLIGTLAKRAEAEGGYETYMVTPDKDFAQLISDTTYMWKPGRKGSDFEVIDLPAMKQKWQVERPDQVIDILGLWGDASDNIPGVPGIGQKTAQKLLAQFDSLEGILANVDQLKGKQKEKFIEFADQARLSRKLAEIIIDAPTDDISFDDLELSEPDLDALSPILAEAEFNTLSKRILGVKGAAAATAAVAETEQRLTIADTQPDYVLVDTDEKFSALTSAITTADTICFDTETTGLNRFQSQLLGIAFAVEKGRAFFLPTPTDSFDRDVVQTLFPAGKTWIGHNLKYDLHILKHHGISVEGVFFDTMIVHSLLHPEQRHTMDALAESLLNYTPQKLADVAAASQEAAEELAAESGDDLFSLAEKKAPAKASKDIDMTAIDLPRLAEYAAEDADITFQLYTVLAPELKNTEQDKLYDKIEAPLIPVLVDAEAAGIAMDSQALSDIGNDLESRITQLGASIQTAAGREFNLNSPKQLGEILFGEMQLVDKPKKTKTGQFKTDEATLTSLATQHQIVADILAYREASKLKSTYIDALPTHIEPHSGRVHTHYHQLLTATGRLASSDPNLQNIPVRSELGREIRKAFVPRSGFTLFCADYSQIELRVMAALSGDPSLIAAFTNDEDVHTATAAKVFDVDPADVSRSQRSTAKMVNFGIIYGISAFGLSQRLGIAREHAGEIIEAYFELYPGVKAFMDSTIEQATKQGYVSTLAGRRRYLPDLKSSNDNVRGNAERAAINTPIQGTSADMIKLAMIDVAATLREQNAQTQMLLQVHDELVFDLHPDEAENLIPLIVQRMEKALPLPHGVPAKVEHNSGLNWLAAH